MATQASTKKQLEEENEQIRKDLKEARARVKELESKVQDQVGFLETLPYNGVIPYITFNKETFKQKNYFIHVKHDAEKNVYITRIEELSDDQAIAEYNMKMYITNLVQRLG